MFYVFHMWCNALRDSYDSLDFFKSGLICILLLFPFYILFHLFLDLFNFYLRWFIGLCFFSVLFAYLFLHSNLFEINSVGFWLKLNEWMLPELHVIHAPFRILLNEAHNKVTAGL